MPSRETKVLALLYIVLTISILIGQEPPAYFENSRDSVDKHDYSIICYPIFFYITIAGNLAIGLANLPW